MGLPSNASARTPPRSGSRGFTAGHSSGHCARNLSAADPLPSAGAVPGTRRFPAEAAASL